jgi:sugar/nucleoside kinase (ribokinase family)
MATVFVFGGVAADVMIRVPRVPRPGGWAPGDLCGWRPGGGPANVAAALASAGHDVQLVATIGDDATGRALLDELARYGVGVAYLQRVAGTSPHTLILVDGHGERTILVLRGGGLVSPSTPSRLPDVAAADVLFLWNVECPAPLAAQAASALVVTVLPDADGPRNRLANIVIGSRTDLPAGWATAPFEVARKEYGERLRWVVLTDGERGAVAYGPAGSLTVPARPANQVDSTGAGDAFAAGVVHTLMTGGDMTQALACATRWGAATVQTWQSFPPGWTDVFGAKPAEPRPVGE